MLGEMSLGGDIFGQKEHAAGLLVETMNHAQSRVACSGCREAQLPAEALQHTIGFPASGNRCQPGGLIDSDDVCIVIQDVQVLTGSHVPVNPV
jgi:hypothetical protein